MFIRALATSALAVAVVCATAPAATAAAVPPAPIPLTCGAVLQQDAYLDADLTCPTGDGVHAAANLTIDLRGHKFGGSKAATGVIVDYPASVRVEHGRISGWGTGMTVASTQEHPESVPSKVVAYGVNFAGNGIGLSPGAIQVSGETSPFVVAFRSYFSKNAIGVGGVVDNSNVTVSRSTFIHNKNAVSFSGDAFTATGSIQLDSSVLVGNTRGVYCSGTVCNLRRNNIRHNTSGVVAEDLFTFLAMDSNTVWGNFIGVDSRGNLRSALTANTFALNETAVSYKENAGSLVRNNFHRNTIAFTMVAGSPFPSSLPVTVTGNTADRNTGDGFTIDGNAEVQGNVATANGGHGIYAPAANDLGGNTATGNAINPQCVGVAC